MHYNITEKSVNQITYRLQTNKQTNKRNTSINRLISSLFMVKIAYSLFGWLNQIRPC